MISQNDVFHYPPELFDLLIDTIPLLNKSKKGVILFFKGAGVSELILKDISRKIENDRENINKYEITRTILSRINENSDLYLRERREIVKRITEIESFDICWDADRLKAKGLVYEIQRIVNVKDAFVRMQQEKDKEFQKNASNYTLKVEAIRKKKELTDLIKKDFYALFSEINPQVRGLKLELVLNRFFEINGIGIREAF